MRWPALQPRSLPGEKRSSYSENNQMKQPSGIVLIVDDDPSVRTSLQRLFSSVGLAAQGFESAEQFSAAAVPDIPGCLIVDVRLPGPSGLEFQDRLLRAGISIPIIFISGHGDVRTTVRAMKGGAVEFLTKPLHDQELLDVVYSALQQDKARREQDEMRSQLKAKFDSLTKREREVMALVVTGRLNKQIADDLTISEITVKLHRGQVMKKMRARSVVELVKMSERLSSSDAGFDRRH
jgi:FixJ family two-component response regulator